MAAAGIGCGRDDRLSRPPRRRRIALFALAEVDLRQVVLVHERDQPLHATDVEDVGRRVLLRVLRFFVCHSGGLASVSGQSTGPLDAARPRSLAAPGGRH